MKPYLKNKLLITLGWLFIVLAGIGVVLPLVPTTPFLIVALGLFSQSSPRFHRMLLNNPWFGPSLKQWEENKTLARATKYKASMIIFITFAISIAVLSHRLYLQMMLVAIGLVLLSCIWRIKER